MSALFVKPLKGQVLQMSTDYKHYDACIIVLFPVLLCVFYLNKWTINTSKDEKSQPQTWRRPKVWILLLNVKCVNYTRIPHTHTQALLYGDRIMEVMTSWGERTCCLVTVWITAREGAIRVSSVAVSVRASVCAFDIECLPGKRCVDSDVN